LGGGQAIFLYWALTGVGPFKLIDNQSISLEIRALIRFNRSFSASKSRNLSYLSSLSNEHIGILYIGKKQEKPLESS
jgi:hypothetical protein